MTTEAPKAVGKIAPWKILLPILAMASLSLGTYFFLRNQAGKEHGEGSIVLEKGAVLPDLELFRFPEGKQRLSEVPAKVVLINFWASWCESCILEMPSIDRLHQAFKDKGFLAIAMNVDESPEKAVPPVQKQLQMTLPVYVDRDQKLSELFDVHSIPVTLVVEQKTRKVLYVFTGSRDWNDEDMRTLVARWLEG